MGQPWTGRTSLGAGYLESQVTSMSRDRLLFVLRAFYSHLNKNKGQLDPSAASQLL